MKLIEVIKEILQVKTINESNPIPNSFQRLVNNIFKKMEDDSFEYGLGEMDELAEIESVDNVIIIKYLNDEVPVLSVDLYVNSDRRDFDNYIGELEYNLSKYISKVQVTVNRIIDTREAVFRF